MASTQPEKPHVRLGIMPLTDCALIALAKERGVFAKYGLDVTISKEPSWASLRDKIMLGSLDGAHMLAPMLFAATLGLGAAPFPMVTGLSLGLNGNAVTVSNALYGDMVKADPACAIARPLSARPLRTVIAERKRTGSPLLTFAMVFPFSLHNYLLRYWLASAGIHPDRDLRLIVVPPPQMGAELSAGTIDGFCSGGPWNQAVVLRGLGHVAITGYELWNNAPEKVLGVSRAWAEENPKTHFALICAIIETARWLDDRNNIAEAADILASDKYVGMGTGIIESSLLGKYRYSISEPEVDLPDYHVFHKYKANFPWVSHGVWILSQMYRWGQLTTPVDLLAVARSIYRPDLYRDAARSLGVVAPAADMKQEGLHRSSWKNGDIELGPDRFFDERTFDPTRPVSYLEGFETHSLRLPPDKINLTTP